MKISRYILFLTIYSIFSNSCDSYSYTAPDDKTLSNNSFESTSFDIDKKLNEISGLQIIGENFLGFNDSGGKPELYSINRKGEIIQTIELSNAKNEDWESIAMNDSLIFIADIGNNRGNRKDLCIYYIERKEIKSNVKYQKIEAQKISFSYPEQIDFSIQSYKHNFDSEAIIWHNNKIYLFTKEWKDNKTHQYSLEVNNKHQKAKLIDTYNTRFLVTAADIMKLNKKNSLLVLIGYTKLGTVHLIQTHVPTDSENLLDYPKQLTFLGTSASLGQVEGIAIQSPNIYYYSAENYKKIKQHITKLELQ